MFLLAWRQLTSKDLGSMLIGTVKTNSYAPDIMQNKKTAIFFFFFLTAIWLTHGQLWAILKGTASLTRC